MNLFVGLDLAWSTGWTGAAVVDDAGRVLGSARLRTDDEVVGWVSALDGSVLVAGVDAPLLVPNETGMREAERQVVRAFGRYGASTHVTNRERHGARPRALRLAERLGWVPDPEAPVGERPVCLEVYPHAALVGLLGLPYRLDYKKGGTARRAPGFRALVAGLESIEELGLAAYPRWGELAAVAADPRPGDLDRIEDEVDAIVCAHVAWRWHHRRRDLQVYGDRSGFIVAPPPPTHPAVRPPAASRGSTPRSGRRAAPPR